MIENEKAPMICRGLLEVLLFTTSLCVNGHPSRAHIQMTLLFFNLPCSQAATKCQETI